MRLIRGETFRFFAFGFAAGAVLVFGAMDQRAAAPSLVTEAHAQALDVQVPNGQLAR